MGSFNRRGRTALPSHRFFRLSCAFPRAFRDPSPPSRRWLSMTKIRTPTTKDYLLLAGAVGFGATGCIGEKPVPVRTGLFPPFGFFASRFRPPRPLATNGLLI